jgi:LDH2 family malate/lactate/ureidoglycolate dehydrogenase
MSFALRRAFTSASKAAPRTTLLRFTTSRQQSHAYNLKFSINNPLCVRSFSTKSDGDDYVQVTIDEAKQRTQKALQQIGWDEDDARLQADIMTAAELCGNNQGLVKMYQPSMMAPAPGAQKPVIERDTPSSAVVNARQSPGMLAAVTAADLAVNKCKTNQTAISIVSSYNTSTSSGQLAYYVERIARQGYIGLALANSPEFVAPAAGAKPVFGTNPLAVGIPQANSYPFTVSVSYDCDDNLCRS